MQAAYDRQLQWICNSLVILACGCCLNGCGDTAVNTIYSLSGATTHPDPTAEDEATFDESLYVTATSDSTFGRFQSKTFDDLKFDINPGDYFTRDMLTEEIEAMNGQQIRIRGWMYPTFKRKGITKFVLVRDNQECCFGPGAALFDCIIVEMVGDESTIFRSVPISVEGTFSIKEFIGPDQAHLAVFRLDAERVH